jgi:hypothetical protein
MFTDGFDGGSIGGGDAAAGDAAAAATITARAEVLVRRLIGPVEPTGWR